MKFKSYYIHTFGCAMNEYDSERIAAALERRGLILANSEIDADVIILNTCSVREKPQIKISSYLGKIRVQKNEGRHILVGITGCVAQQDGENLLKKFNAADFIMGTESLAKVDEILERAFAGVRFADTTMESSTFSIDGFKRKSGLSAFVTIMKGCENFCSYCIVPYVRGMEASRASQEILDEIKRLTDIGVKEVCLLGQNVNSYGKNLAEYIDFSNLLRKVNAINSLERIRFVTSHPKDFSEKMIHTIAECEKIWKFIHLPLQSGSDKILQAMNRGYTFKEYASKIDLTKKIIPDVSFSSDFIVGFPGETDDDFEHTLNALNYVGYDRVFAFNYSPRPKTKAFEMKDDVMDNIKSTRLARLFQLQNKLYGEKLGNMSGKIIELFVTGVSNSENNIYTGQNVWNNTVHFKGISEIKLGSIVKVRAEKTEKNSLFGYEV